MYPSDAISFECTTRRNTDNCDWRRARASAESEKKGEWHIECAFVFLSLKRKILNAQRDARCLLNAIRIVTKQIIIIHFVSSSLSFNCIHIIPLLRNANKKNGTRTTNNNNTDNERQNKTTSAANNKSLRLWVVTSLICEYEEHEVLAHWQPLISKFHWNYLYSWHLNDKMKQHIAQRNAAHSLWMQTMSRGREWARTHVWFAAEQWNAIEFTAIIASDKMNFVVQDAREWTTSSPMITMKTDRRICRMRFQSYHNLSCAQGRDGGLREQQRRLCAHHTAPHKIQIDCVYRLWLYLLRKVALYSHRHSTRTYPLHSMHNLKCSLLHLFLISCLIFIATFWLLLLRLRLPLLLILLALTVPHDHQTH